jgi:hypothetical protein
MAYVSQEKKAKIAAALKPVVPAGWKYSLAVDNHSTIVMTIASAPVDLPKILYGESKGHVGINHYHFERHFEGNPKMVEIFKKIVAALNLDNHDRSDIMTDYFDVGHYVTLQLGRWNKPFVVKK